MDTSIQKAVRKRPPFFFKQAKLVPKECSLFEFLYYLGIAQDIFQILLSGRGASIEKRATMDTQIKGFEAILLRILGVYKESIQPLE